MTIEHPIATVRTKAGKVELLVEYDGIAWQILERDQAGDVTPSPVAPQPTRRAVTTAITSTYGAAAALTTRGMDWFMHDPDGTASPCAASENEGDV